MFNLPKQYLKTASDKLNRAKINSQENYRRTANNANYFNKIRESYEK